LKTAPRGVQDVTESNVGDGVNDGAQVEAG